MTEPNTELPPLRVRIAQAMAAHPSLGGLYSDHPDSYLNPHKGATADYVTEADAVLAVVEAEVDRVARARDGEIERLAQELYAWRTGARRRTWPIVEAAPDGVSYAAYLARAQGTEGGEEHDRLLRESAQRMKALHDAAQTLLEERCVLSWLHAEAVWQQDQVARTGSAIQQDLDETLSTLHVIRVERDALQADMRIRQGALNDVLGRDRSENSPTDYYGAVEDVAVLRRARDEALAALEKQQDLLARAVLVWPQDAMVQIRECIADPSRMLPRQDETFDGWSARAVLKLMESWRAERVEEVGPVVEAGVPDETECQSIDIEDFLDHVCGRESCGHRRGRHPFNGECVGAWAGDACACTGFEEPSPSGGLS